MSELTERIVQKIIEEFIARFDCMSGTGNGIRRGTVVKIRKFAEKEGYIKTGLDYAQKRYRTPMNQIKVTAENIMFRKAFALACRFLADNLTCPAVNCDADFPECSGELNECGDVETWKCWQRYFIERTEFEAVCRECGCTQFNACTGGCYWVEDDLCSKCAKPINGGATPNKESKMMQDVSKHDV